MLAELRAAGLRFSAEGGTLYVEPASVLTDSQRAAIREHKAALLRELSEESREGRRTIIAAHSAATMSDFREALCLGRLHVCCNCSQYTFGTEPSGLGHCRRFKTEAWPFVPFWCSGFEPGRAPVAPECLPDPDGARARIRERAK